MNRYQRYIKNRFKRAKGRKSEMGKDPRVLMKKFSAAWKQEQASKSASKKKNGKTGRGTRGVPQEAASKKKPANKVIKLKGEVALAVLTHVLASRKSSK